MGRKLAGFCVLFDPVRVAVHGILGIVHQCCRICSRMGQALISKVSFSCYPSGGGGYHALNLSSKLYVTGLSLRVLAPS